MRNALPALAALALCCLASPSRAQVILHADSNQVETGNPLALHFRLPKSMGKPDTLLLMHWMNVLPAQNILSIGGWELSGGQFSKTLTAIFFDEDSILLPELPILLRNGDTLFSNPLTITVTATPAPEDLNDMAPIKDIHREPSHWTDYWPWLLGGLGVLALLALMYRFANRKSKKQLKSRAFQIPPQELALKKLEMLAQKNLPAQGLVKEHYAELSYILREFLERQFEVSALESTTAETMSSLVNSAFPAHFASVLQTLLEQADLAKFAKIVPPETFHEEAMHLARLIILEPINHELR